MTLAALNPAAVATHLRSRVAPSAVVRARKSFVDFLRYACDGPSGGTLRIEPFIVAIAMALTSVAASNDHLVIASPPGLGKSTLVRHHLRYCLCQNPSLRTVWCSLDVSVSETQVNALRGEFASRLHRSVYPSIEIDNDAAALEIEDGGAGKPNRQGMFFLRRPGANVDPSVASVAFHGMAANRRVDIGVFDDIETMATASTQEGRDKTFSVLMNRWLSGRLVEMNSKGRAIILSNFWHDDDLIRRMEKTGIPQLWLTVNEGKTAIIATVRNLPISLDSIGQPIGDGVWMLPFPLDSSVYCREGLVSEERNNPNYAGIYEGKTANDKSRMFQSWASRRTHDGTVASAHGVTESDGLPVFDEDARNRFAFAWGYDMAGGKRFGNCLALWSVDSSWVFRPVEVHFADVLTTDAVVEIVEDARRRGILPCTFRAEKNAVQVKLVDEMRVVANRRGLRWAHMIEAHQTGANKMDAKDGLPSLETLFKNGVDGADERITEWPTLESSRSEAWSLAESQFLRCPRFFSDKNPTPEYPMSSWFAIKGLRERATGVLARMADGSRMKTTVVKSRRGGAMPW